MRRIRSVTEQVKICKDCPTDRRGKPRPAPYPGPRCATCHRAFKRASRDRGRDNRASRVYGVPPGAYAALRDAQGGVCAGCGPRTGRNGTGRKRMAIDHEHNRRGCTHPPEIGCPQCVRGLLCSTCNQAIGDFRDDPLTLLRLALYLLNPPARAVLTNGSLFDQRVRYAHDAT